MQWRNNKHGDLTEEKIWCMTQNISDGINKFSSSFSHFATFAFLFFRKYYCFVCLKSRYIQMILNLRSTAIRYFSCFRRLYICTESYKKETIMMMWCHIPSSQCPLHPPSIINIQQFFFLSTFILMCLLDVQ